MTKRVVVNQIFGVCRSKMLSIQRYLYPFTWQNLCKI